MNAPRSHEELVSWGRVARGPHELIRPRWRDELPGALAAAAAHPGRGLAVGLGRSYGDSGLNPGGVALVMTGLDRVHAFDRETGVVRADAGLSLDALIRLALPHGWFPPVVPGAKQVTLGGAVANDIHGKNHHRAGTFGRHVRRLALRRSDGPLQELGPDDPTGLFAATVGGLGLTGLIEWIELQLEAVPGAFLDTEDLAFGALDEFFALAAESEASHAHTVAWIDCTRAGRSLGRGVFSRANWSARRDRPLHRPPRLALPVDAPSFALNPVTLRAFNAAYYGARRLAAGRSERHYEPVFFPLDAIRGWNRLYGPAGLHQHQCVIPPAAAREAMAELLGEIAKSGEGSFLVVLKTFGALASPGLMSFPAPGATLALDFRNRGEPTLRLLERLDAIVAGAGGRLYPAKEGRMSARMLAEGYPNLDRFRAHLDPGLSSAFWRRVQP